MNTIPWPPRIGAWYLRWDKDELFQVVGYDQKSDRALIENAAGTACELDHLSWSALSPGLADPPEDWTGPVETVDVIDLGAAGGDPVSEDVSGPRPSEEE